MMNGEPGGGFFGFGFFTLLLIIAVIALIIWMVIPKKSTGTFNNSGENSLEILKKRLAKGEISEEEYERLKRKLEYD
ncbi:SHOCT domain-containing protein [Salipaludibacillus aurantiacus]|uniref:Putative membrane protein n=1 Tax=Salipaludibacillus aurantiacus TaxID=1601833 RepID=A0A1H9VYG4_9BACI|nr:SHOCT domain-containing protein [Salipaludibacillus aurantiacus]SES26323.1 putative membrane protein [Salipaludibacillus aurantiacus]